MSHRNLESRLAHRGGPVAMAVGVAAVAVGLFGHTTVTRADTTSQGAEGDAHGVSAVVSLLTGPPLTVGPIAPAGASQPGGPTAGAGDVVSCPNCVPPILTNTGAINTRAAATLTTAANNCTSPGFPTNGNIPLFGGALTGGSGCASVAGVALLTLTGLPAPLGGHLLDADVIQTQSVTQSCTATPIGNAGIVGLKILGITIPISALPVNLGPNTDLGNILPSVPVVGGLLKTTLASLGITIILNEEHYDNVGHGLTVNGVHVIVTTPIGNLAAADLVIAHSHSEAMCAGVVPPPIVNTCSPPASGCTPPDAPVIAKVDSTNKANPGDTVDYALGINQHATNCGAPTIIVDSLPAGFTFVKVVSGPLGNPVVGTANGRQTLSWINLNGFTGLTNPIAEIVTVAISPTIQPDRSYFNDVQVTSQTCGTVQGTDPGITVTLAAAATPTPTPTATATATPTLTAPATPTPSPAHLPNTAAAAPGAGGGSATGTGLIVGGGLVFFGGLAFLARRRRTTIS